MCCYLRQCVSEREIKTAISERTAGEGSWIQGLSLFSSFSLQINIHEQSGSDLFCISWGEYYAAIINGLIVYKLKIGSFCNSVIPAFFMFLAKEIDFCELCWIQGFIWCSYIDSLYPSDRTKQLLLTTQCYRNN